MNITEQKFLSDVQVGACTLMLGDCLERMKEIPTGSVDMILADPPYGTTQCKWDSVINLPLMWEQLKRIVKPNGAIVMTASQPFTSVLVSSNITMFKYCWVWVKGKATGHLNSKKMPLKKHEDVAVFCHDSTKYYPQGLVDTLSNSSRPAKGIDKEGVYGSQRSNYKVSVKGNYPKSVLEFSGEHSPVHPTQKPVALMEYLIKTYTNEGEAVLDFAMGSGTTGVACVNTNRSFIGIEMDETYFNVAVERMIGI